MQNLIDKLKEFNKTYSIPYNNANNPSVISEEDYKLRYNLIKEELDEYLTACKNNDLVEVTDAIGDMLYLLVGTCLSHGLHGVIENVFNEIHSSNMSKLGEDGKPIYREDGKILKGPNYFKPNIKKFL